MILAACAAAPNPLSMLTTTRPGLHEASMAAAAAAMLASCSPGLVVVNIDNGFGAAAHAAKIICAVHR